MVGATWQDLLVDKDMYGIMLTYSYLHTHSKYDARMDIHIYLYVYIYINMYTPENDGMCVLAYH